MLSRQLLSRRLPQAASSARFAVPRAAFSEARALRAAVEEEDPHLVGIRLRDCCEKQTDDVLAERKLPQPSRYQTSVPRPQCRLVGQAGETQLWRAYSRRQRYPRRLQPGAVHPRHIEQGLAVDRDLCCRLPRLLRPRQLVLPRQAEHSSNIPRRTCKGTGRP